MPTTQTIVKNRGSAIFRIIFGFAFVCLGAFRHFSEGAPADAGLFTLGIGLLFMVYGIYALVAGSRVTLQTTTTPATASDRLAVILKMKNDGLISETEYEAKRQEILKNI